MWYYENSYSRHAERISNSFGGDINKIAIYINQLYALIKKYIYIYK